jgi:hypothetical protein
MAGSVWWRGGDRPNWPRVGHTCADMYCSLSRRDATAAASARCKMCPPTVWQPHGWCARAGPHTGVMSVLSRDRRQQRLQPKICLFALIRGCLWLWSGLSSERMRRLPFSLMQHHCEALQLQLEVLANSPPRPDASKRDSLFRVEDKFVRAGMRIINCRNNCRRPVTTATLTVPATAGVSAIVPGPPEDARYAGFHCCIRMVVLLAIGHFHDYSHIQQRNVIWNQTYTRKFEAFDTIVHCPLQLSHHRRRRKARTESLLRALSFIDAPPTLQLQDRDVTNELCRTNQEAETLHTDPLLSYRGIASTASLHTHRQQLSPADCTQPSAN